MEKEIKKMKKEIARLQKEISTTKYAQFKRKSIRNLKIFGSCLKFVAPYVITVGLVAGAGKILGNGLPIKKDMERTYEYTMEEMKTPNEVTTKKQFAPFNESASYLEHYGQYEQIGEHLYQRKIKKFGINKIDVEKIKELFNKQEFTDLETIIGEPYLTTTEETNSASQEEYYHLVIYDKNSEVYIEETETDFTNILITLVNLIADVVLGYFIYQIRTMNDYSLYNEIEEAIITCKMQVSESTEKLKLVLSNYEMISGENDERTLNRKS